MYNVFLISWNILQSPMNNSNFYTLQVKKVSSIKKKKQNFRTDYSHLSKKLDCLKQNIYHQPPHINITIYAHNIKYNKFFANFWCVIMIQLII